jgi:creatinine amidohydrolase/Fe(II)-dependent formamide hydrolase-like protein
MARRSTLLFPTAVHGYTPHHLDFPGTVSLRWNVFVEYLLEIGRSLCHHGFDRILFVNGHGSNQPLVELAARLLNVEHPRAVCMASWYLASTESKALLEELRESEPGGMAHACELETSLYLALQPELVQMGRSVREISPRTPNLHMDWADGPLSFMPHWRALTESGMTGDATFATAEKGRRWLTRTGRDRRVHRRGARAATSRSGRPPLRPPAAFPVPGEQAGRHETLALSAALVTVALCASAFVGIRSVSAEFSGEL